MCGGGKAPETVRTDPEADADKAAAEAAVAANAQAATRRRTRRMSALGVTKSVAESSALTYGKTVLGG